MAIVFGLASVVSGGSVLFGGAAARASAGDVVGFVVGFNFAAGFAYVAAGVALLLCHRSGVWLAIALAASNLVVLAAFGAHVALGGAFEVRTAVAMTLRTALWISLAWASYRALGVRRAAEA